MKFAMRYQIEAAMAGIAAGVLISGVMVLGRRTGLLHKTLAEEAEDWLDRAVSLRLFGLAVAGFTSLGRKQV